MQHLLSLLHIPLQHLLSLHFPFPLQLLLSLLFLFQLQLLSPRLLSRPFPHLTLQVFLRALADRGRLCQEFLVYREQEFYREPEFYWEPEE